MFAITHTVEGYDKGGRFSERRRDRLMTWRNAAIMIPEFLMFQLYLWYCILPLQKSGVRETGIAGGVKAGGCGTGVELGLRPPMAPSRCPPPLPPGSPKL